MRIIALDREEFAPARGFFLSPWNGTWATPSIASFEARRISRRHAKVCSAQHSPDASPNIFAGRDVSMARSRAVASQVITVPIGTSSISAAWR